MIPIHPVNTDLNVVPKFFKDTKDLYITSIFRTIQGEGPFAGYPAVFVRLAGCNFGAKTSFCDFCFPAEAKISTPKGLMRFSDVSVGDELFTLNTSGEVVTTKVKKALTRRVSREDLVTVKYKMPYGAVKKLTCTREHPFNTTKRGFVPAGELKVGEKIYHADGSAMKSAVKKKANPMFNLVSRRKQATTYRERFNSGEIVMCRTEEQKVRYSLSKMGPNNPMKRHAVRLASALGHHYAKSGLESKFERAFKKLKVPAKYCGNTGTVIIGDDHYGYRFPDFVVPGTNKVIETYDTTYRYTKNGVRRKRTKSTYEKPTAKFYARFGYEVLFLTNKDWPKVGKGNLVTREAFSSLVAKVGMFLRNGAEIISVTPVTAHKYKALGGSLSGIEVVNFSCTPHNTFLVGGLHTHNCDTSFQLERAKLCEPQLLIESLRNVQGRRDTDILVITGGEPMLQPLILKVLEGLTMDYAAFQFETNGTQGSFIDLLVGSPVNMSTTIVVSPKANLITRGYAPLKPQVAKRVDALKFVLSADPENPHHGVPPWAFEVQGRPDVGVQIYVSPMAVYKRAPHGEVSSIWDTTLIDAERTAANYQYAAQYAMTYGLLLSLQTHLFCALP